MDKEVVKSDVVLPGDLALCHEVIRQLLSALQSEKASREGLEARLDQLLKRLYGPKGERFDPNQPGLFDGLPETAEDLTAPAAPSPQPPASPANSNLSISPRKKGHGRNGLPNHLPRKRVIHDLTESQKQCPCCQNPRVKIDEEISERLDYQPSSLFIVEHVRFKYACSGCLAKANQPDKITAAAVCLKNPSDLITTAPLPEMTIPKGLPGPGLLAHVVVSKYHDHLPLHRQESILARMDVNLSRSTLCDWMAQSAELLKPLYQWMLADVMNSEVIHLDETHVPVQEPGKKKTKTGRLWVLVGDRNYPHTLYHYTPTRKRDGPKELLANYKKFIQADAANVFDGIYLPGEITEVACWAHARRYFYEARNSDQARAFEALARIRSFYAVEDEACRAIEQDQLDHAAAESIRLRLRREKTVLKLSDFGSWIDAQRPKVLPKSPIGKAILYAQRHWAALNRFTEHGFLDIDNNEAEQGFRGVAIGRRNWLFAGSDAGGSTAAVLYSFTQSCRTQKIDPFAYLTDVFTVLPSQPKDRLRELAPFYWAKTKSAAKQN
jgi:transposase